MTYFHYLPNMLFVLIIAHLHDKYRQTRLCVLVINVLCLLGGIIYTIDISIYFPIIGCFMLGIRFLVQPIAVGELARSYPPEQLNYKLPVMKFFLFLGSGPTCLINFLSKNVNYNIGTIHIRYGNFPGLIVAITFIVLQVLTMLLVQNISLEFDLKSYLEKEKYSEEREELIDKEERRENIELNSDLRNLSILKKLKRLLTNFDIMLTYFLVFLFNYIAYFSFSYVPLLLQAELN